MAAPSGEPRAREVPVNETLETVEDWSNGHGHMLPDSDGPRMTVIYADGCTVVPGDNGSWTYTPASEPDPTGHYEENNA
jgi:hypothetical protein